MMKEQTMREIYLDNSATTRVYPEVSELVRKVMESDYGNTSSLHRKGMEAELYIRQARKDLAAILKISERELIFTSGGTESDNLAIIGAALANRRAGKHIITSAVEHAAVSASVHALEEFGFTVTVLPVDHDGRVDPESLRAAITDETILVSIMYVNSETGALQPVEELAQVIHRTRPSVLFHVDAIQAFGKYQIRPARQGIDLLSVSSHKFHGPKGVGFLYVRSGVRLHPLIFGGGHQEGMRSGTENVPGVAGMALAAKMACDHLEEKAAHMRQLKDRFVAGIREIEGTVINGRTDELSAPHIVSVSFQGVRSEVLLHALEEKGIYVSAGSACSSNKPSVSQVLLAMGIRGAALEETLRFSFCEATTMEEIELTLAALREILPLLRRFVRK